MQIQRVTTLLNLTYTAHHVFYTFISQPLAQRAFVPFQEIPFLSLLLCLPICHFCKKALRISKLWNGSKSEQYLQTSWKLGEDSIYFDSESSSCDFKHCFELVKLGQSLNEQNCCQVLPCRQWAICLTSWAWDWKSQALQNAYSVSGSSYDNDPSHPTSPSLHSLKCHC